MVASSNRMPKCSTYWHAVCSLYHMKGGLVDHGVVECKQTSDLNNFRTFFTSILTPY